MFRVVSGLVLLFTLSCLLLVSQNKGKPITIEDFSWDANRDAVQNTRGILAALQISRGNLVADVGAGSGYHAMLLSEMVGPEGRVFAENIDDEAVRYVLARIKLFNLTNVESVKGEGDNPLLPERKLDAVLIVDTFHHFTAPDAMLEKIRQALKPGGRLVIADYSVSEHRGLSRAAQIRSHEIDPVLVRAEAERAGLKFVRVEDPFFIWKTAQGNTRTIPIDLWLMTLKRPE
jgi:ubiquinone/menaquinone biosynthesis C-methylase UbiE